jgi:uncharacterized membrane protein
MFLSLCAKEEISLSVGLLGLFIAFIFKERKIGLITFFTALLWFLLMFLVIIPHFRPVGHHFALAWYQFEDKRGIQEFIPTFDILFQRFFTFPITIKYYHDLLRPFAYLPLLGLPFSLLILPELTVNVLSSHSQMVSILLHYDSGITPWLIIATIFAFKNSAFIIGKIKPITKYTNYIQYSILTLALIISIRVNYHRSPLPYTPACWCVSYSITKEDIEFENLLKTIPQNASISASPEIRPHLTHRHNAFTIPDNIKTADYIALINQNRLVGNYDAKDLTLINQLLKDPNYSLVKHLNHFYLFKKKP